MAGRGSADVRSHKASGCSIKTFIKAWPNPAIVEFDARLSFGASKFRISACRWPYIRVDGQTWILLRHLRAARMRHQIWNYLRRSHPPLLNKWLHIDRHCTALHEAIWVVFLRISGCCFAKGPFSPNWWWAIRTPQLAEYAKPLTQRECDGWRQFLQ